jgi:hypothetical protein
MTFTGKVSLALSKRNAAAQIALPSRRNHEKKLWHKNHCKGQRHMIQPIWEYLLTALFFE